MECLKEWLEKPLRKDFPQSKRLRLLVSAFLAIIEIFLLTRADPIIINKPLAFYGIISLGLLVFYLSVVLWIPVYNIWEQLEQIDFATLDANNLRIKVSGSLNTVSTLLAFSIAFIVLSLSIIFTSPREFSPTEWNVFKLTMGLLVLGVIFLLVTLEAYDTCLTPTFNSIQISRIYTKGWWFYTFGIYAIVIGLLLAVYLLEPVITIVGVLIFIITFSYYLRTPLNSSS